MEGYIYHITNKLNNKKYIGQTVNINRRKAVHFNRLYNKNHHSPKLQLAWNKYGEENFEFTYNTFTIKDIEELNFLEIEEIKKYDSFNNGYNMTTGGDGARTISKDRQQQLLESLCVMTYYKNVGHSIEEYFKWHRNTTAPLLRKERYPTVILAFEELTEEEKKQIATNKYIEWGIDKLFLERGNSKNWLLNEEDYNFIFAAQELGFKYTAIGNYFGISPATVKDWLNGRARKDKKQNYQNLSPPEKEYYKQLVKNSDLYKFTPLKTTQQKLKEILLYLCLQEFNIDINEAEFERIHNWAQGTCEHIRRPNLYLQAKEYYSHLTSQDKNKILQQNVYQTAVEKSRNKAGNLT